MKTLYVVVDCRAPELEVRGGGGGCCFLFESSMRFSKFILFKNPAFSILFLLVPMLATDKHTPNITFV